MNLLLGSNSKNHGAGYLDHLEPFIKELLGDRKHIAFVPFALKDHEGYTAIARTRFETMGYQVTSVHEAADAVSLLEQVDGVFIGGGNTFRLLNELYIRNLVDVIKRRVEGGMPYIGTSAGTNVATINIKTTNDMPIVYPPSFDALGLVPFNINAHYLDADPNSTHMGETREQRLKEFLEENSNTIVGLREGAALVRKDNLLTLIGNSARIFSPDGTATEYPESSDLPFLLN